MAVFDKCCEMLCIQKQYTSDKCCEMLDVYCFWMQCADACCGVANCAQCTIRGCAHCLVPFVGPQIQERVSNDVT